MDLRTKTEHHDKCFQERVMSVQNWPGLSRRGGRDPLKPCFCFITRRTAERPHLPGTVLPNGHAERIRGLIWLGVWHLADAVAKRSLCNTELLFSRGRRLRELLFDHPVDYIFHRDPTIIGVSPICIKGRFNASTAIIPSGSVAPAASTLKNRDPSSALLSVKPILGTWEHVF
jgi:hypothetical protein